MANLKWKGTDEYLVADHAGRKYSIEYSPEFDVFGDTAPTAYNAYMIDGAKRHRELNKGMPVTLKKAKILANREAFARTKPAYGKRRRSYSGRSTT